MDVLVHIKGMNCSACEKEIKEAITQYDGVHQAEVNYLDGVMKLDYNQEKVTLEKICETVEALGYAVDR